MLHKQESQTQVLGKIKSRKEVGSGWENGGVVGTVRHVLFKGVVALLQQPFVALQMCP